MKTELRKKAKDAFKKNWQRSIVKVANNPVLGRTMKNVRTQRDIKLVTTKKKKKLFCDRIKLSYYNFFRGKCIDHRNEKNSNIYITPILVL